MSIKKLSIEKPGNCLECRMTAFTPIWIHTVLEVLAYTVGTQVFLWQRRRLGLAALSDKDQTLWVVVGAALGAALGSKLAFWLEDPAIAFASFPDWRHLLQGKSVVGGLLGGLLGVEISKKLVGQTHSTGDAFVLPLAVGMCIGRIGCFLAGLADHTYGNATTLPWGIDFGDGIARHPTQLYEIVFIVVWTLLILRRKHEFSLTGDAFRTYLSGYLLFRFVVEFIKPIPMVYPLSLSGIQWLCLFGLAYYAKHLPRLTREFLWDTK
jgi:phosphatidylglycerol---prolipoprotein diacylglyceryl transferase